ncbi:cytochrome P450 18a1-like [Tetranychus urticae]|uniref:Cytochrome P450 n=1 Tax=Tetranychus urticae TaxID=32264 RepID=T1KZ06_TETUR|nr:cytochrome P450 18a1-like [Tetranychus urticae]
MFFIDSYVDPTLLNFFYGLVTLFVVHYVIKFVRRVRALPPGPWGLPIVGYLPFIRQDECNHMTELAAKYGPVFSLKCGQFDVVVINQWKCIKEALANEHLLGRPKETILPGVIEHFSFVEMSGERWKEQRRVALTTLRDVGLGKSKMEDSVRDEIDSFTERIKSFEGKPISISNKLSLSISNNISTLVFGHTYAYDDPVALDMENMLVQANGMLRYFNVAIFMPSVASLILRLNLFGLSKFGDLFRKFESHINDEVIEHRKKDIDDNGIKDYIDGFLHEMSKRQNEKDSTFNVNTLQRNASMFYAAGSDTITTTLQWIIMYLVKYPEYQNKIRDEIKQTIGLNRQPENIDRQQMPFTMAFIYEALRHSSIIALNLARRALEDTKVGGYSIPKDSFVIFNFWSVHHDPNLWDNPELFKPERFLDEDKSKAIKPPYLVAFSGGKRVCPGESFAYLQIFLYLVSILQQFEISVESGKDISLERVQKFSIRPKILPDFIFTNID